MIKQQQLNSYNQQLKQISGIYATSLKIVVLLLLSMLVSRCNIYPPSPNDTKRDSIDIVDSIDIANIYSQLQKSKIELINIRDKVDSSLFLIYIMENNVQNLFKITDSIKIDASYKDTIFLHDTIRYHEFIGNGNIFIRADELMDLDTLGLIMNDSVLIRIWIDGQEIINL